MDRILNKHRPLLICLALSLTTLVVFRQVRSLDFIDFDDYLYVANNNNVQGGLTWQGIKWAFTTTQAYNWHPLTWFSHMLDCRLYGVNPAGHHFTNVILHIANTLFLFLVLRLMTGSLWRSAFVAALFALHPLHVESVAWVSERKDVLSTFFWMLTMWFYIRYVRRPCLVNYLPIAVTFALGLMAKQMLVTLPFVLLLLDYWPLQRLTWNRQNHQLQERSFGSVSFSRCLLEKLPLLVMSVVASVIVFLVQSEAGLVKNTVEIPIVYRLGNVPLAYVKYIIKMFWPVNLGILYPHPGANLSLWQALLAGCFLSCISILIILAFRRRKWLIVGWLWYLGTLVPVIGLVQVGFQAMADRYTYIPLIGLFLIITWGAADIVGNQKYAKIGLATAAVTVLSALTILTSMQLPRWKNTIAIYEHTASAIPNNDVLRCYLGWFLMDQGKLDEAVKNFNEALQINPNFAVAHGNIGCVFVQMGKPNEAIRHFTEALQIEPDSAKVHNNLGAVLAQQGKVDEAVKHYTRALQLEPDFVEAHNNLASALAWQGRFDEAIRHFNEALRIKPDDAKSHNELGRTLLSQGRLDEAIICFNQTLQIEPNFADAHYNLGIIFIRQNKLDKTVTHFTEALRIRPDFTEARSKLGYALTRQGSLDEGIKEYRKVLQMLPDSPDAHNNLGVALAMQGKFDEAVSHFNEALRIDPDFTDARRNLRRALNRQSSPDEAETPSVEPRQPDPSSSK